MNSDQRLSADYIVSTRSMYMKAEERFRAKPTTRRRKFTDMVFEWCRDQAKAFSKQHTQSLQR